ncbi:hypothetical protein WOLCODRAFT_136943 [Wolfiporia cocos MD-104 SS10]|uniref:Uncharacterized protein n=1 Tax=Wolfiporia cocos (strain MD-104) TaxID=742152 RepID=A0A2H3JSD3_WOLCO|nr:hypothetical protein WOLCODRAFT_136943 [Wolfiporia cocos MD-104 SS10]
MSTTENPPPVQAAAAGSRQSSKDGIAALVRPHSQSPTPAWSLAGLFLASSLIPPKPHLPPLMHRIGFGAIFAGTGYVLSCGDAHNGSGMTTAWSLTYLFLNFRKSLTTSRSAVSLALTGATLASSVLYGTEYFLLQERVEEEA